MDAKEEVLRRRCLRLSSGVLHDEGDATTDRGSSDANQSGTSVEMKLVSNIWVSGQNQVKDQHQTFDLPRALPRAAIQAGTASGEAGTASRHGKPFERNAPIQNSEIKIESHNPRNAEPRQDSFR